MACYSRTASVIDCSPTASATNCSHTASAPDCSRRKLGALAVSQGVLRGKSGPFRGVLLIKPSP